MIKENELKKGISIVMPCLNEELTLKKCIVKAKLAIEKLGLEGEIIIADNGSTDNSKSIALAEGARVVEISEKGYGSALRGGIKEARYEYIIMGDADDSYDFSAIDEFIEKLDEGYELVMGNRFKGGIEKGAMPFSHQYIGNPLLSGLGRLFFKTKIKDFHCGIRAFRKDAIEELGLCTTGMEFASEMVVKAVLFNLKITEVPTKLYPDGRNRPPHLRSIPDGLRHLEFLLLYSPRWLFAYPGIVMFFIGIIVTLWIYVQPLHIGPVEFEVTTMLYSALFMLLGVQFIQFSIFATLFAERIGQIPKISVLTKKISDYLDKRGYLLALIIILVGIIGVIYSLMIWKAAGFGPIYDTKVCKTAIMFGSLFSLGVELLLFTLFSRVLKIGNL